MTTYFIFLCATLLVLLILSRVISTHLEITRVKQKFNMLWYLYRGGEFKYRRTPFTIFLAVVMYMLSSNQDFMSTLYIIEMFIFIALAVIGDALGQLVGYGYIQIRCQHEIKLAKEYKQEIDQSLSDGSNDDTTPDYYQQLESDLQQQINDIVKTGDHLGVISNDGGQIVANLKNLPPITYVVEPSISRAETNLEGKQVKVTTLTKDNKLPFKDNKLDVLINIDVMYDREDLYRCLKPGGYALIYQRASDNYQEFIESTFPLHLRGNWNLENCRHILEQTGFKIIASHENRDAIKFTSFKSLIAFMKDLSSRYGLKLGLQQMNFYGMAINQIKQEHHFNLSTHDFFVVVKK